MGAARGSRTRPIRELACLGLFSLGCRVPSANSSYLHNQPFRRTELIASLVNPENDYSRLRIAEYAVDGGWDALPEWNPPVEVIRDSVDLRSGISPAASSLKWSSGVERDPAALRALGEQAFFRYPVQLVGVFATRVLAEPGAAARYGFWSDATAGVGGLVKAALPGGGAGLAYTCATCHAAIRGDRLVTGVGNEALDLGRLLIDGARPDPGSPKARAVAAWGPGRLDVSTSEGTEPIRFPALRATRFQSHLQADATVAQRDLISLAIRLETLIITSNQEVVRPPREVTLALASYVWSLGDALPPVNRADHPDGAAVFESTCAGCHRPPGYSGSPVAIGLVGTDPVVGRSRDRGTGNYEIPSLRGVGQRGRLLHDGAFASLSALLDPGRAGDDRGHHFGLQLSPPERAALLGFVQSL
jgi:cytochrome c553